MTKEPANPNTKPGEARVRWLDSLWTNAQLESVVAKYNTYDEEIVIGRLWGEGEMAIQTPSGLESRGVPVMKIYLGMRNPLFAGGPESRFLWWWVLVNVNESAARLEVAIRDAFEELRKARTIQNGPLS